MSITFSIEGIEQDTGLELPCPSCGLRLADENDYESDCVCMGYGGPPDIPIARFEMNLANGNAEALLTHLGFRVNDFGAPATDVIVALESNPRYPLITSDKWRGLRSVICGRTREQVQLYYETLRRIALKAQQYSRAVVWG